MKISCKQLAKTIDHTNIERKAAAKDIKRTCQEAKRYGFRGVDVNPLWVGLVKRELNGTDIKVVVLIDPPMGLSAHSKRVEICKQAKKDGANELDVVINVIDIKYERYDDVLDDLEELSKILPTKIIIGSGYLADGEIKIACELAKKAGAFCVKTATEKDPLDRVELKEKARHLGIMKKSAPGLKIKASGKIQTYKDVLMMLEAGADIIGTSSSIKIMQGCKRNLKSKKLNLKTIIKN